MRMIGRLFVVASTLVVVLPSTTAAQDHPEDLYWSCYTGAATDPIYFSGVWEEKAVYQDVYAAWVTFLSDKCPVPAAKPMAQGAPAASAAPAATTTPMYWGACQLTRLGRGGYSTYFSDVFPSDLKTADGNAYRDHVAFVVHAYGEFISTKYGRERDNPWCSIMTSEAKLRAIYKGWIDEANKTGETVMTGWRHASPL
jgi:hypothetical protein